jgi:AraC-like DNA-binding protein
MKPAELHHEGYRTLYKAHAFSVAEYHCCGEPPVTGVEASLFPEIVMVQTGAYVRCDSAGMVYLDPTTIGFFEAHRPYTIRHPRPQPDVTTVISIRDPEALADALGIAAHPLFGRSAVRASASTRLAHRRLVEACGAAETEPLVEELAVTLILDAVSASYDLVLAESDPAHRNEQAIAIADYVNRHLRDPIVLRDIGDATGLSQFQVCRVFRAHMGVSVREYITALRVDAAVAALLETDTPITDIALDTCFSSHSHLSTTMRRVLGTTPREVRARRTASV